MVEVVAYLKLRKDNALNWKGEKLIPPLYVTLSDFCVKN